jgi:hypothetical protein
MNEKDLFIKAVQKASGSMRVSVLAGSPLTADKIAELLSLDEHPDTELNLQKRDGTLRR